MAIDTRNKRASAINHGSPWRGLWPEPDGSLDQGDRQTVPFMYSGILAEALIVRFSASQIHALTGAPAFHTMLGAGIESHALTGSALTHRLTGADTRNKELKG